MLEELAVFEPNNFFFRKHREGRRRQKLVGVSTGPRGFRLGKVHPESAGPRQSSTGPVAKTNILGRPQSVNPIVEPLDLRAQTIQSHGVASPYREALASGIAPTHAVGRRSPRFTELEPILIGGIPQIDASEARQAVVWAHNLRLV